MYILYARACSENSGLNPIISQHQGVVVAAIDDACAHKENLIVGKQTLAAVLEIHCGIEGVERVPLNCYSGKLIALGIAARAIRVGKLTGVARWVEHFDGGEGIRVVVVPEVDVFTNRLMSETLWWLNED